MKKKKGPNQTQFFWDNPEQPDKLDKNKRNKNN